MIRISPGRDIMKRNWSFQRTRWVLIGSDTQSPWLLTCSQTVDLIPVPGLCMKDGCLGKRASWGADHQDWSTLAIHRFLFSSSRVWKRVELRTWKSLAKLNISIMVPRFNLKGLTWIFEAQINHKGLSWDLEEIKNIWEASPPGNSRLFAIKCNRFLLI